MPLLNNSQKPRPTLPLLIIGFRILLIILAAINLCALSAAFQIYSPKDYLYTSNNYFNFQDSPQFAFNAILFLSILYSFLGTSSWSRRIRITLGLILIGCNASLAIIQLDDINKLGGCNDGTTFNTLPPSSPSNKNPITLKLRCIIQMFVSSISLLWSLCFAIELVLTDMLRKRESDLKSFGEYDDQYHPYQMSSTASPAVHLYRPDLNLRDNAGSERNTRGESMELESLPAYEQRQSGPRTHIIDMANVRHMSRPTRGSSMRVPPGALAPVPIQQIQSPPPSYQVANL